MSTVEICGIYVRARGLSSRLIELEDLFSHAATRLPDGTILDARDDDPCGNGSGVRIRPGNYLDAEPYLEVSRQVPAEQWAKMEAFLRTQVGKPYDPLAILDFMDGGLVDVNFQQLRAWICSELRICGLLAGGLCRPIVVPPYKVSPGLCLQVELQNGSVPKRWNKLLPVTLATAA